MDYSELLQYQGYLYLNSLFEPEDGTLIVDIDRCIIPEISSGENNTFSTYDSVNMDETLPVLRIEFDTYVAYSVRNESFTALDKYEVYEGGVFSLYSKSRYLDFIELGTIADDIHPGKYKHYGINALNHIIDVISTEPPRISFLQRDGLQNNLSKFI
ncbi:hypothetical protein [Alkalicoccus daliensis]|uniref:Uncharacterized protein n=1 Tax=Alkalicoccus daliensis TaxID=745820 RepID=A0A1H0CX62_9BACI|nr:hypothetical protein [Alkalicoccus daliensis]SDN62487.1 hypothetical protein SAMN04488053_102264 [Alkalicoccus daliensis]